MARWLVQVVSGPENTTRAALALLIARSAAAAGHDVTVFLAGDGTDFIRPETRAAASGVGTGSIEEHWQSLVDSGARFFGSGMSARARNIPAGEGVELVLPARLVELIAEAETVLVY